MANSAEESLMALLEAMLTLAASEVIRPKPPAIKPGGYPEDHFLDLTDSEKEEFSCNICYQVLKEARQCVNKHMFCSSCLLVWSTTGQYDNRDGCPVCRTRGDYIRNKEVDDRISAKKIRCHLESCKWLGPLSQLSSHRHTNYLLSSATDSEENMVAESMPRLVQVTPHIPHREYFTGTGLTTHSHPSSHGASIVSARMLPLGHLSRSRASPSPSSISSTSEETVMELPWRARVANSARLSSFRMPGVRLSNNNRITFSHTRPQSDNNNNIQEVASAGRSSTSTIVDPIEMSQNPAMSGGLTPRPPSIPRSSMNVVNARRLPRIVNPPTQRPTGNRSQAPASQVSLLSSAERPRAAESLGEIRGRLQESRTRLDSLMTSFSGELDRNRQAMAAFQLERERHRQEQLEEVRELGHRLGQVALELRRLLEQRRHIHNMIDDEDDIDDDDDDDDDDE